MADKPRILITNDDGIHAEGLTALESAMRKIGKVYVVAPESEMSGASHSLTLARPLKDPADRRMALVGRRHTDRLRHARA
jgi:5'-nucleotidase